MTKILKLANEVYTMRNFYVLCIMCTEKILENYSKYLSLLTNNSKNTPKNNSNTKRQSIIVMAPTPTKVSKKSTKK